MNNTIQTESPFWKMIHRFLKVGGTVGSFYLIFAFIAAFAGSHASLVYPNVRPAISWWDPTGKPFFLFGQGMLW